MLVEIENTASVRLGVSALYAQKFRRFVSTRGILLPGLDGGMCVHGHDMQRVEASEFCAEFAQAVELTGDCDLGWRFGTAVDSRVGLPGIAAATASTLANSLRSLLRWESLISTLGAVRYTHVGRTLRLTWRARCEVPVALVEAILSGWITFGRYLATVPLSGIALELAHARHPGSAAESIVGCPVVFGAEANAVTMHEDILAGPSRFADEVLHRNIAPWLDETMGLIVGLGHEFAALLCDALSTGLALADAGQASTAQRLGLSRRTFQRELAAHGVSYRRVLYLIRAHTALLHLSESNAPLLEIAARIGYHEQSTFSRAVRRWTGRSPREIGRLFGSDFAMLRT